MYYHIILIKSQNTNIPIKSRKYQHPPHPLSQVYPSPLLISTSLFTSVVTQPGTASFQRFISGPIPPKLGPAASIAGTRLGHRKFWPWESLSWSWQHTSQLGGDADPKVLVGSDFTSTSSVQLGSASCQVGWTQRLAALANTRILRLDCKGCKGFRSSIHLAWKSVWPQLRPIQVLLNAWETRSLSILSCESSSEMFPPRVDKDRVKFPRICRSLVSPCDLICSADPQGESGVTSITPAIKEITNSAPSRQCHICVRGHQITSFVEVAVDDLNFNWTCSGKSFWALAPWLGVPPEDLGDAQALTWLLSLLSTCPSLEEGTRGCSSFCRGASRKLRFSVAVFEKTSTPVWPEAMGFESVNSAQRLSRWEIMSLPKPSRKGLVHGANPYLKESTRK